jgi:hypothetical protein
MTKRCSQCQLILSIDLFSKKNNTKDGFRNSCKSCDSKDQLRRRLIGIEVKILVKKQAGGCQNELCCSSNDRGRALLTDLNEKSFQLDHIDESLKIHNYETQGEWIAGNEEEFWSRVRPNIQVLCYQCHAIKTNLSQKLGNVVHGKMYGRKSPAQFIDPDYNLFNQVQTTHTHLDQDNWSFEGNYSVCRDSEGFLIKYIDLQTGSTQFQIFNKDGEQI